MCNLLFITTSTPPHYHGFMDLNHILTHNTPNTNLASENSSVDHYHTLGTQNPGFFSSALSFRLRFLEMLTLILKMP